MADIIIETERLILRTIVDGDIAQWVQHMNTPAVTEHLGGPRDMIKIEANFAQTEAAYARDGFGFMMMQHKASGDFIGNCGLKRVDSEYAPDILLGEMEIGWSLREDYWRCGYAYEAAVATFELAFERLGASRVFAFTTDRNEPSWRLMEKLDMLRRDDLAFDDLDYADYDNPTIVYEKSKLA
jgi:RimJ/RimL family protein N-acetyltransferase